VNYVENAPPQTEDSEDAAAADLPAMTELETAQAEAAHWRDLAVRGAAELDNFRKRMAKEKQEAMRYANMALLEMLLPILDNFDFGLQAAKAESESSSIYLGMSMVLKQIQDFLKDQGVEEVPAVGLKFDPNVHDAVSQQPSADVPEGQVIAQTRRGYRLKERLLRPASVIVAARAV
jgi:molecular chaperone GrpE